MSINVTDLTMLDAAAVEDQEDLLAAVLLEHFPEVDARRGALRTLLLHLSAVLSTKNQTEIDRLRQTFSIGEILSDPTLADTEVVDRLAANYRLTRDAGIASAGNITVAVSALSELTIGLGAQFVAGSRTYVSTGVYTARVLEADVVTDNDRLLVANNGRFEFQVPVTATMVGPEYQLRRGEALLPSEPIPNFVSAAAASDFSAGIAGETDEALLSRALYGAAAKTLSGRDAMSAALRERFPTISADSIVGFGDSEMLRDQHSVWPVSIGGRTDWYIQTAGTLQETTAVKTATLVKIRPDGTAEWEFNFLRDDQPGLYELKSVQPETGDYDGTLEVLSQTRQFDATPAAGDDYFTPDLDNAAEAAFSRFQTLTLRFHDSTHNATVAGDTVGTSRNYRIVVRSLPDLAEIQAWASSREVRHVAGDLLVRAPVPCFVKAVLDITLSSSASAADIDMDALKIAVEEAVAAYGFEGRLPASALCDAAAPYLPAKSSVIVTMIGRYLYTDTTMFTESSTSQLTAPSRPDKMTTARTVAYFLPRDQVSVNLS